VIATMPKWLTIALLFAALAPGAPAQMRGGFGPGGGFRNGGGFAGHHGLGLGRGWAWYGDPLFYADYAPQPVYAAPSPSVVIVQPTAAAAPPEPKPEPLMIEWQGDRYVRSGGRHESSANPDYSEAPDVNRSSVRSSSATQTSQFELPPAVLVYRDGHLEEVSDYVIANGNLYARGNYWHDGFWTKTVQLSALDIPTTVRANSDSGVKFVLPSGPNEVVTRP